MADCVFCRILAGELPGSFVHRDERVAAFMDIQPVNPGHLLVVPTRHAPYLADLDGDTTAHMMRVGHRMAAALRASSLRCEGVNLFLADGEAAMQEVFHAHLHVFPRFAGDGFGLRFAPEYHTRRPPREELDRTAAELRARSSTRLTRHVSAPRSAVYRALLDPRAVASWMVPIGMTSQIHQFDAREGGSFRISLTYDELTGTGKTTAHTDTYHGRFVELVPDQRVVEVMEFETDDPRMRGEMTVTLTLTDSGVGTDVQALHDALPPGLPPADNETGWRMALDKLAALVEAGAD